jgi:Fic family protein
VAERLAVALVGVLDGILQSRSEGIGVTPDWLCGCHRALAAALFPEWAGRYRDVNVRVGTHTPPPFNEVPVLTRLFCDDLAERLRHVGPQEEDPDRLAELLAWADWRFQWIHPFRDFNGRIGRVLLAVILYTLALPHVQTASVAPADRRQYLAALRAADGGDLRPLTRFWIDRLAEAL